MLYWTALQFQLLGIAYHRCTSPYLQANLWMICRLKSILFPFTWKHLLNPTETLLMNHLSEVYSQTLCRKFFLVECYTSCQDKWPAYSLFFCMDLSTSVVYVFILTYKVKKVSRFRHAGSSCDISSNRLIYKWWIYDRIISFFSQWGFSWRCYGSLVWALFWWPHAEESSWNGIFWNIIFCFLLL